MKQTFAVIIFLALITTGGIYFFIPQKNTVISEIKPACSIGCVQRITGSSNDRMKWLPEAGKHVSPTEYIFDDIIFLFPADNSFNNNVSIKYKNIHANSLFAMQADGDSVLVKWILSNESGNNPFTSVSDYFALKHIKAVNEKIMQSMLVFLSSKKNVYGFDVQQQKLLDSTLISIKDSSTHYPTVTDIYNNIEKLRQYASASDATTTNAPMLNIEAVATGNWFYMVALPVDKVLNDKGNIRAKRMLAGGKILVTENITGGFTAVAKSIIELEKFRADYNYMSPAIPYQSLVTDRTKETDSTKWVTRLYYPVF